MVYESELKIKEVIQRIHNVKSFRLEAPEGIDFKAGQFLFASLTTGPELKRCLSISSSPTEKGYIEFTKKITESDFSRSLDNLGPEGSIKVQYPFGKFTLQEADKKIAFISGGIGITPIRSICKYAVDKKLDIDIILLYANRSLKDIVFRQDFELMQEQHHRLKVVHVLTEPAPGFKSTVGRISSSVIKSEIPDFAERKFFLCGPPLMVEAMKNILNAELVLAKENIITENFQGY